MLWHNVVYCYRMIKEHDRLQCTTSLLALQDHSDLGVKASLDFFSRIMKRNDRQLWEHLWITNKVISYKKLQKEDRWLLYSLLDLICSIQYAALQCMKLIRIHALELCISFAYSMNKLIF